MTHHFFLIDTGACLSILPVSSYPNMRNNLSTNKLYAANGTVIQTYGQKTLDISLNLRRKFRWTFIIADVQQAIIGCDFLSKYKLVVDIAQNSISDRDRKSVV